MRTESDSERDAEGVLAIVGAAGTTGNTASTASDDRTVMPAARVSPDDRGAPRPGLRTAVSSRFRLPGEDDPSPRSGRLLGLCAWAAAMAFLGLIPGGRLAFSLALNLNLPPWYAPVSLTLGVLGVAAVAAGFFAIHRERLPVYLFTVATTLLLANLTLVYTAL